MPGADLVKVQHSSWKFLLKRELHPYGEFIPKGAKAMIIGSFPIGKFTDPERRSEIKSHELDFFFGGEKNLLWKILSDVFDVSLKSKTDVVKFLRKNKLAVGDVMKSCRRKNGGASDADLYDVEWNHELLKVIKKHRIEKVYFTSRKVESWFRRLFPNATDLKAITLISPSGQSLRGLGGREDFKAWVKRHPGENKLRFIIEDYRKKFLED